MIAQSAKTIRNLFDIKKADFHYDFNLGSQLVLFLITLHCAIKCNFLHTYFYFTYCFYVYIYFVTKLLKSMLELLGQGYPKSYTFWYSV